jgi:hypothetical protein
MAWQLRHTRPAPAEAARPSSSFPPVLALIVALTTKLYPKAIL